MITWGTSHISAHFSDELIYRSYCHQRMTFPEVPPERWALIYDNVPVMEERYLKTFIEKLFAENFDA